MGEFLFFIELHSIFGTSTTKYNGVHSCLYIQVQKYEPIFYHNSHNHHIINFNKRMKMMVRGHLTIQILPR